MNTLDANKKKDRQSNTLTLKSHIDTRTTKRKLVMMMIIIQKVNDKEKFSIIS